MRTQQEVFLTLMAEPTESTPDDQLARQARLNAAAFGLADREVVDWDEDGRIDVFTSTENYSGARYNRAVDFFRNIGTLTQPVFDVRKPMTKLNDVLNAHHDVKLNAVDLNGDGHLDLVTSTDPGKSVFSRSFLDEAPVQVSIKEVRP